MGNSGFSVSVTAVDNFTKSIDQFNKKMAGLTAPVTRLNKSMAKFSDVTGISKVATGVTRLTSGIASLAKSTASASAPLAAITSAASVAGLIALTEKFATFGSQVRFASQNIGVSVDSLAALQGAAALAGSSSASLTSGMLNLSTAITDAAGGRNMEALGYFKQLGINIKDATGHLRTADQVLPDVADGIAKISNPALQRRVAAAFGLSDDLLPFLRRGSAGLREYQAEAKRYGAINEDGARASEAFREAQARLTLAVEGLGNAVAVKLAPVLGPVLGDLSNWVASHHTDIADAIGGIAKQFEAWAKGGGLDRVSKLIGELPADIEATIVKFGQWEKSAEQLGDAINDNVVKPITSAVNALGKLRGETPATNTEIAAWNRTHPGQQVPFHLQSDAEQGTKPPPPFSYWNPGSWLSHGPGSASRGIRNNNPTNIKSAGFSDTVGSDGPFGVYASMANGVTAAYRQLLIDQDRGQNTIEKLIADPVHGWAPASDGNDTESYIKDLESRTGLKRNQPFDARTNRGQAKLLLWGLGHHDSGANLSNADLNSGIDGLQGPISGVSPVAGGQNGTVKVEIVHRNPPAGTSMVTKSEGSVKTTVRVESSSLLAPN